MQEAQQEQSDKLKAFISYSRTDLAFADKLCDALDARGFEVLIDRRHLPYGEEWKPELLDFVRRADAVVFVVSPSSIKSDWCNWEVRQVKTESKRLVPVVFVPVAVDLLPSEISDIHLLPIGEGTDFDVQCNTLARVLGTDWLWLKEHTRVAALARRWEERNRKAPGSTADLLLRGEELAEAQAWISRRPREAPEPTELQRLFLEQSRRGEEARLAREREQIARTRRIQKRSGWALAGVGVLLAAGLVGVILQDIETTKREQAVFTSKASDQIPGMKYDRALRLGLQAYPARGSWWWTPQSQALTDQLVPASLTSRFKRQFKFGAIRPDLAWHGPNGWWVARDQQDGTSDLWNPVSSLTVHGHKRDRSKLQTIGYSQDGQFEALRASDDRVLVRSFSSGAEVSVLATPSGKATGAKFSRDGKRIITSSNDNNAQIWDVVTGKPLALLEGRKRETAIDVFRVSDAVFSPDGQRAVIASWDTTAAIWDAVSGQRLRELPHPDWVTSAAVSPNGKLVATGCMDGIARIWSLKSGEPLAELKGHRENIWHVAFSPDGKRLATGSDDATSIIWDLGARKAVLKLAGHEGSVLLAEFSGDGREVLTLSGDGSVRLWDAEVLDTTSAFREPLWVADNEYSGHAAVSTSESRGKSSLVVYLASGRKLLEHDGEISVWAFTSDGRLLITGSKDKTARVWDAVEGKLLHTLRGHEGEVTSVAFSSDGAYAVTGSSDKTARIWRIADENQIAVLGAHGAPLTSVASSPDGQRVATASEKDVRIWSRDGALQFVMMHASRVRTAVFSPTGNHLATIVDDDNVWLWRSSARKLVAILNGGGPYVRDIRFSTNGDRLAATTGTGSVRIWDTTWLGLEGPDLVERVCAEKLVGAEEFTDGELLDPVLADIDPTDAVARNPCLRSGPLTPAFYTHAAGRWLEWARKSLAVDPPKNASRTTP